MDDPISLGFITGMDLSYQSYLEPFDVPFKDEQGNAIEDMWSYVKNNGVNLIRVRLFHTPDPSDTIVYSSNLEEVLLMCEKIAGTNNRILLDFHYSDTWADPGKQFVPAAWEGRSVEAIEDSIYQYTKRVLEALHAQNTLPYMVQIGNETNSGFLWDYGRLWIEPNDNFAAYKRLVDAASQAVSEMETEANVEIYTMLQHAGIVSSLAYFSKLKTFGIEYDVIGLSHYHLFHSKDLTAVEDALHSLANVHRKPMLIVETNYPWTLDWADYTNNWVGATDQLIEGYPATPAGQKAYYEEWVRILKDVPNGLGQGFVWWAPDFVAFRSSTSSRGSFMENLTVFDFDKQALPIMEVFRKN